MFTETGFMEISVMPLPIPVAVWPKAAGTKDERGFFVLCS
jgi:hypothetical protein